MLMTVSSLVSAMFKVLSLAARCAFPAPAVASASASHSRQLFGFVALQGWPTRAAAHQLQHEGSSTLLGALAVASELVAKLLFQTLLL